MCYVTTFVPPFLVRRTTSAAAAAAATANADGEISQWRLTGQVVGASQRRARDFISPLVSARDRPLVVVLAGSFAGEFYLVYLARQPGKPDSLWESPSQSRAASSGSSQRRPGLFCDESHPKLRLESSLHCSRALTCSPLHKLPPLFCPLYLLPFTFYLSEPQTRLGVSRSLAGRLSRLPAQNPAVIH